MSELESNIDFKANHYLWKMTHLSIEHSWQTVLAEEFQKEYYHDLSQHLEKVKAEGAVIYPPTNLIFNAFNLTPFNQVKVVILGQDPYHKEGQAMGLSFSVPRGVRVPPSLKNIYKEINRDLGIEIPLHGDLTAWSKQGVLLLNAMLTVESSKAGSHSKIGWQTFTDAVIKTLSDQKTGLIFMLWGNFAKSKSALIDSNKHFILKAAHPSPLARNAFNDCKHFSKTNKILRQQHKIEINWQIND